MPVIIDSVRHTQGKTLAVMQVSGRSQWLNAVNHLRVQSRRMRMFNSLNQSSAAKACRELEDDGRMKPSPYCDRVVDVMEELLKFKLFTRNHVGNLVDRYTSGAKLQKRSCNE